MLDTKELPLRLATRGARAGWIACALALMLPACAALEREFDARKPSAEVEDVRLTGLDFHEAQVRVDVRIDNPNPFGVDVAGLDYEVLLAGERLVSGASGERAAIPGDGAGEIGVPIRIGFQDVHALLGGLAGREVIEYGLELAVTVDVPALGETRLPLQTTGVLPVPQRPGLSLSRLRVERLDTAGARVLAEIEVDNPGALPLRLEGLDYALGIDGRDWVSGRADADLAVPAGGRETITLPLELDFVAIGTAAYRLLSGGGDADYRLRGELAGGIGERDLGGFDLSFDESGRVRLER